MRYEVIVFIILTIFRFRISENVPQLFTIHYSLFIIHYYRLSSHHVVGGANGVSGVVFALMGKWVVEDIVFFIVSNKYQTMLRRLPFDQLAVVIPFPDNVEL